MRAKGWPVAVAVFLGTTRVGVAGEGRATARLSYRAPADKACPDEQSFRDIVAGRLGYDPFEDDAPIGIAATVEKGGRGLVGRVRVKNERGDDAGSRDMEAADQSCTEIATSMAIAISIVLDPFGEASSRPSAVPPPPPKEPAKPAPAPLPKAPIARDAAKPAPAPPPKQSRFTAHAALGVGLGVTPGWSLGPQVGAGLRWDRFTLELEGRIDVVPALHTTESKDRVRASVLTVGPRGCVHFGPGLGCAAVHLGAFQGSAADVTDPETITKLYAAADLRGGVDVPLGNVLSARALLEARVPLVRAALVIDDRAAWEAPPVAAGLSVGLAAVFP